MSRFLPLDHSSSKEVTIHSKTVRWEVGMAILHKEMGILQKEVAILHKEVGHKVLSLTRRRGGILHKEVAILHQEVGHNPSQGGTFTRRWNLSMGGLTTLSLKESFTRRWNPSQGGLKKV